MYFCSNDRNKNIVFISILSRRIELHSITIRELTIFLKLEKDFLILKVSIGIAKQISYNFYYKLQSILM